LQGEAPHHWWLVHTLLGHQRSLSFVSHLSQFVYWSSGLVVRILLFKSE
jgi:hypothetical protein